MTCAEITPQRITPDERDTEAVRSLMQTLDENTGPRVGDFVRFSDGTLRRISYHWRDDEGWDGGVQTSDGGSFHLGRYGCSFSGGLYSTIPTEELVRTEETMPGSVWTFHHDLAGKDRGVYFMVDFRVYTIDRPANR